jgi:hypothetical protein
LRAHKLPFGPLANNRLKGTSSFDLLHFSFLCSVFAIFFVYACVMGKNWNFPLSPSPVTGMPARFFYFGWNRRS